MFASLAEERAEGALLAEHRLLPTAARTVQVWSGVVVTADGPMTAPIGG